MRASPITLYDAAGDASASMAGNLVFGTKGPQGQLGQPLNLEQIFGFSIEAYWTATANGTLALQASNDGTNWSTIPGTAYAVTEAGSNVWNVPSPMYLYVQLIWTVGTASSGTLAAIAYVRGF